MLGSGKKVIIPPSQNPLPRSPAAGIPNHFQSKRSPHVFMREKFGTHTHACRRVPAGSLPHQSPSASSQDAKLQESPMVVRSERCAVM